MSNYNSPAQPEPGSMNGDAVYGLPVRRGSALHGTVVRGSIDPADANDTIDFYALFHRALRGRYLRATLLACVGAAIGAVAGYFATRPQYKSEGLLKFAYAMPQVLQETDQNKPLVMFESFIRSQQMRIGSRELVEKALHNPIWTRTGQGASRWVLADFADQLVVEHPGGTEHLRITYMDSDPAIASAAVRAVISTFQENYLQEDQQLQQQRLAVLGERRKSLTDQLTTVGSRADQLALMDTTLTEYLKRQVILESELKTLEIEGLGDNHKRVAELRGMLDRTRAMIQQYSTMARRMHDLDRDYESIARIDMNPLRGEPATAAPQGESDTRRDLMSVQSNMLQMQRLQADGDIIRKELAETTQRMDALQIEAGLGTRLEVVSDGAVPLQPFRDRRSLFALAGAGVGATMPWLFFALIGTIRPVYRRSIDAIHELSDRVPHLGTLPALKPGASDLVLSAGAAHSVHQMRIKLQMLRDRDGQRNFLISSPCSGEGKTTLTTSLGLSFAASGARTLLIDLDFVGRRLTRGFRCEQREGAHEALTNVDARGRVREVTPGLWVMPAGNVDPQQACTISSSALRSILDQTRDAFDIVLIDTGPVLGSVETSVAASVVDGVVLTVSRGQEPWRVDRTIEHLTSLGAKLAGLVFNRAEPREFTRASIWPDARSQRSQATTAARNDSSLKADLIVQSVMTFLPAGFIGPDSHIHQALPDPPTQNGSKTGVPEVADAPDVQLPEVEPLPA